MIPIIWQLNASTLEGANPTESPGAVNRLNWYGQVANIFPYACFGGNLGYQGDSNAYNVYLDYYNQLENQDSPFTIDMNFSINDEGNFIISADVELYQNIQLQSNKIFFVITNHNNTNYSSTVVAKTLEVDINITQIGQTFTINETIERNLDWDVNKLKAVAVIQSWESKTILQSEQVDFEGLIPSFIADINEGPAALSVDFLSSSLPINGIESWEWDFDGDGIVDSQEENPTHLYQTPGLYDVTLRISDGNETREVTWEDYIEVNSRQTASGQVAGVWYQALSPYTIFDSVYIAEGKDLTIEPGVTINCSENSQLNVFGSINANAHDNDAIVFSSETFWKGISLMDSNVENEFDNCQISNAGSCALKIDNSVVTVFNSKIFNCFSDECVTAIHIQNSSNVTLQGNLICNNYGSNASTIYVLSSNPDILNNVIVNNTSERFGSIELDTGSNAYLQNNTISHNMSGIASLRIKDSFPIIRNSIIWEEGNVLSLDNGMPAISYSCINGGYAGSGNIEQDPLFENPSNGTGNQFSGIDANWILEFNSPCVDAGNSDAIYNDIEDHNNPGFALFPAQGNLQNDMGAFGGSGNSYYEYVSIDEDTIIKEQVSTLSNYPNPFNPTTKICFSLNYEHEEIIELEIYNVKGQRVKTIHYTPKGIEVAKSMHSVVWNGVDNMGKSVPSGIYFCQIKSERNRASKKMLLLK